MYMTTNIIIKCLFTSIYMHSNKKISYFNNNVISFCVLEAINYKKKKKSFISKTPLRINMNRFPDLLMLTQPVFTNELIL